MYSQALFLLQKSYEFIQIGNFETAELYLRQTLKIQPNNYQALRLLGVLYAQRGQFVEALNYLNSSLKISPKNSLALSNLGNVLSALKKYEEALTVYDKSIKVDSNYAEVWSNKGNVLHELKRYDEALICHDKALSLNPNYPEAWSNKANALRELRRYEEALMHFDKALFLKPSYSEALTNKGWALHELKRFDEAIIHYDHALKLKHDQVESHLNKGFSLNEIGQHFEARECFEMALKIKPDFHRARWAKFSTFIPTIFTGSENLIELRENLLIEFDSLSEYFQKNKTHELYELVGFVQPFYLAYQDTNNREILYKYGQLCHYLMNYWQEYHKLKIQKFQHNEKIKLGIISEHIRNHSVWNALTKGFILNFDKNKFEIHVFHLGKDFDQETNKALISATSFTFNQSSLLDWTKVIIEKKLDVILYPEIGMDNLYTTKLASMRLAPIQIASWGHPETTGLPTIDYFLSAELFEDEHSQNAYTETLIKLPHLGCSYSKLQVVASQFNLAKYGLIPDEPILLCPGTPFKYNPKYDWILIEIVKKLGKCKLVFFTYENNFLSEILKSRLCKRFYDSNLIFEDYVCFLPWLNSNEFYGLMKRADVYLDTIEFSGFNTAMQAIDCGLPIVTKRGNFLRGRLASSILERVGISELVAKNDQSYIDISVKLLKDKDFRNVILNKIIQNRDILYDDKAPVAAFEQFVLDKCK